MTGSQNGAAAPVPRTLFKGVIMLPQPYRRMGYDDKLQMIIGHRAAEATQKTNWCLQSIFKEWR